MRFAMRPEGLVELVASKLNLAPVPAGEAIFGVAASRTVMAGVRLGVFARLARGEASIDELATELSVGQRGLAYLIECLVALGHVDRSGERFVLSRRSRPWLDPASDTYVGTFIEHNYDAWLWWSDLERVVTTGDTLSIHGRDPSDPLWRRYIIGQFELARLSAPEVARAIQIPREAKSIIDLAGGHGWFAAELCRKHPHVTATVIDLPASAAIGRELLAARGMSDRVRHVEGDMFTAELGGPHALALCFNIIHHLEPDAIVTLFRRIAGVLEPGGQIAVLDLFARPREQRPDTSAFLGLFFYLMSGAATYTPDDLRRWLKDAGFGAPRKVRVRRIPAQTLYVARRGA